ncbi:MAG: 23S rRNA (uridine(2552)-2'-O)-methyltransferase RlmE [Pseudomonadota bacterium]|nr:23S rRNA (uridine(2552)-2'-O)-methyltransferase RlmE [Pseudomonadota bacterium]
MKRKTKTRRWVQAHARDPFVRQAKTQGWRSRAVFKLEEIDQRDRLLKPGMTVVELGAAPGGWTQYVRHSLGHGGQVIAVDVLPMEAVAGVEFIQGDFCEQEILDRLMAAIGGKPVDLVISDMAPNMTGVNAVDQPRAMFLAELVLDFAAQTLRPGGDMLVKVFQGEGFDAYMKNMRASFEKVASRKPKASKDRSRELYLLARNYAL